MRMDVMPRENGLLSSSLNPNAPMFVPAAYRNVDDFSDQWWSLIHSSPSFRDYWLRECFSESLFDVSDDYDSFSFLPDEDLLSADGKMRQIEDLVSSDGKIRKIEDQFSSDGQRRQIEEEKKVRNDLILAKLSNWSKARPVESRRLYEKAPKIVNVKVSPRPIHQPR